MTDIKKLVIEAAKKDKNSSLSLSKRIRDHNDAKYNAYNDGDDDDDDDNDNDDDMTLHTSIVIRTTEIIIGNSIDSTTLKDTTKARAMEYVKRFGRFNAEQLFMVQHPLIITDYLKDRDSNKYTDTKVPVQRDVINYVFLPKNTISYSILGFDNEEVVLNSDYYINSESIFTIKNYHNYRLCMIPFDLSSPLENVKNVSIIDSQNDVAIFKISLQKLLTNVIGIIYFFLLIFEKYVDVACKEAAFNIDSSNTSKEVTMAQYVADISIKTEYASLSDRVAAWTTITTTLSDTITMKNPLDKLLVGFSHNNNGMYCCLNGCFIYEKSPPRGIQVNDDKDLNNIKYLKLTAEDVVMASTQKGDTDPAFLKLYDFKTKNVELLQPVAKHHNVSRFKGVLPKFCASCNGELILGFKQTILIVTSDTTLKLLKDCEIDNNDSADDSDDSADSDGPDDSDDDEPAQPSPAQPSPTECLGLLHCNHMIIANWSNKKITFFFNFGKEGNCKQKDIAWKFQVISMASGQTSICFGFEDGNIDYYKDADEFINIHPIRPRPTKTMKMDSQPRVTAMDLCKSEFYLAAGYGDGTVKIWNLMTDIAGDLKTFSTEGKGRGEVVSLVFSVDSKQIICGWQNGYICVWKDATQPSLFETVIDNFVSLQIPETIKKNVDRKNIFGNCEVNSRVYVPYEESKDKIYEAKVIAIHDDDDTVSVKYMENISPLHIRMNRLGYCLASILLCDSFWEMVHNSPYEFPSFSEIHTYFVEYRRTWDHLNKAFFKVDPIRGETVNIAELNDACRLVSRHMLCDHVDSLYGKTTVKENLRVLIATKRGGVDKSEVPPLKVTVPPPPFALRDDYFYKTEGLAGSLEIPSTAFDKNSCPWRAKFFEVHGVHECYSYVAKREMNKRLMKWNKRQGGKSFQFGRKYDDGDHADFNTNNTAMLDGKSIPYNNFFVRKRLKQLFDARVIKDYEKAIMQLQQLISRPLHSF